MDIISINPQRKKSADYGKTGNKQGARKAGGIHSQEVKMIQVSPDVSIKEAVNVMDKSSLETILVVDDRKRLVGIVTDGDVRRSFLNGIEGSDKICKIMNENFTVLPSSTPYKEIVNIMRKNYFKQIPIIDKNKKVIDIVLIKDIISEEYKDNYVVLMAGGTGSRLRPLTNEIPKPMLKVGDKPILEIIINQFKSYGFKNFIISISYLADIVEGYFGDGSNFDVNIKYIRETKRLGTAGCLKFMKQYLKKPFYVMNGDLLTRIDFEEMLGYHTENEFDITMGIKKHQYQIPYGVVETKGNRIKSLVEKPVDYCTINAGVYCLNPEAIDYIPKNGFMDITTLADTCIKNGGRVGGYDIKDYWIDIGHIEDYKRANVDYEYLFKDDITFNKDRLRNNF